MSAGLQANNATSENVLMTWTLHRSLQNAIQLLVEVQIRHQSCALRGMIGFSHRIERDRPHDGAEQQRDDINLNTHRTGDTERARQFCVKT
ncbi:hypothetical protein [Rhizobium leguminosarum]|uniref:hypothetical protein n=1 Tax=Rhizobium leguminosarum TaxID=384 RepID=UPI0013AEB238|nr:hypothetical protein [Rhizobium leguminosarum]